jgi:hypothetical protein
MLQACAISRYEQPATGGAGTLVDRSDIGRTFAPIRATVDRARVQAFIEAIGEANPAFSAGAGGAAPVAIPPTYLFCLEMLDAERPFRFVEDLGIEVASILHGEQSFRYLAPVHAGDVVIFETRVADVFEKKGGALTFVVQSIDVTREDGQRVAELQRTIVVQNREAVA